jgi:hypothetical protein
MTERLTVNSKLFEEIGMVILSDGEAAASRAAMQTHGVRHVFPEGYEFNPRGITLKEAKYAIEKCCKG